MEDSIAIICVENTLQAEENGWNNRNLRSEKERLVGNTRSETLLSEVNRLNKEEQNCSIQELFQNDAQSSVQNGSMVKQEVTYPVNVLHLNVRAR